MLAKCMLDAHQVFITYGTLAVLAVSDNITVKELYNWLHAN
jgi:hypothetical protein